MKSLFRNCLRNFGITVIFHVIFPMFLNKNALSSFKDLHIQCFWLFFFIYCTFLPIFLITFEDFLFTSYHPSIQTYKIISFDLIPTPLQFSPSSYKFAFSFVCVTFFFSLCTITFPFTLLYSFYIITFLFLYATLPPLFI